MTPNLTLPRISKLSQLLLFSALVPLAGCAETVYPPSTPAVVFPSRTEIAGIPAKPPLPDVFRTKDVAVDEWAVESLPLPSDGPYEDPSPGGALLRELTKTRAASVTLSPAMRCAAAEIGRFHLAKNALPVERLRRFIVARCGGETSNVTPLVWYVDAPPGVSDAQILARARETFANALEEPLAQGHHLIGLAETRDAKRAAVVVAIGDDEARLEPGSRTVDARRRITLKGKARGEYAQIVGLVNRGDYAVSTCENDPKVRPPAFALTCELAPGDSFNWVEVLGEKRGRVMLHALADTLLYEGDPSAVHYKAKSYGAPAPVASTDAFKTALVERLNGVRKSAKLPPVVLEQKQSVENERLAGKLLDAAIGRDDDSSDKAALGLLAGWDVEGGTIRGGQFYLGAVAPTRDATIWLESAVERPSGRLTLLDPLVQRIAIGPSVPEEAQGLAAAVTTYSLFTSGDHAADEALLLRRITAQRAARGLPPPVRVQGGDEMRDVAAKVLREEITPRGGLDTVIAAVAADSAGGAYGYVLETNDLTNLDVPEVFLRQGQVSLALAITHHRAPGAAWGQYVVFIVLAGQSAPTLQASLRRQVNL